MATILTSAMVAFKGNSVLLVKHGPAANHLPGTYGLPSGKINKGETAEQAAIREFSEETGLIAEKVTDFPENFYIAQLKMKDGSNHTYHWTVFLAEKFTGSLRATDETEPAWVELSKLDVYPLLSNVKNAIMAALKFINNK